MYQISQWSQTAILVANTREKIEKEKGSLNWGSYSSLMRSSVDFPDADIPNTEFYTSQLSTPSNPTSHHDTAKIPSPSKKQRRKLSQVRNSPSPNCPPSHHPPLQIPLYQPTHHITNSSLAIITEIYKQKPPLQCCRTIFTVPVQPSSD